MMPFPEHGICRILSEVQQYIVGRFRVLESEQDVGAHCHPYCLVTQKDAH